jgi:hypothetical protein
MDRDEADRLFYEHFETIGEITASASRCLQPVEAEEFDIFVKEKLCADDYRRIRAYEGRNRASIKTFLAVVINNLLRDFLDHIWGKVRPTEGAKRKGNDAVLLERLLREHHSFEEAFEIMTTNHRLAIGREEFEELTRHVNPRFRPRAEAGKLPEIADPGRSPEDVAILNQMLDRYCALLARLREICRDLDIEDALIVKFRFEDGRTAGDIEDLLGGNRDQPRGKSLFRRIERLANRLRQLLEGSGFSAADVTSFLANPGLGDGCEELSGTAANA